MRHFANAAAAAAARSPARAARPAAARAGLIVGLCLAAGAACRRTVADPARAGGDASAGAATPAEQAAADTLGRELFLLLDQMAVYQGAHRGRPAHTVAELGRDSLSPTVVRRIVPGAAGGPSDGPGALVAFRRPGDRSPRACGATPQVLEDAALAGGRFTVHCTLADGSGRSFTVTPAAPPGGAH
jgi:hypothetical protein